MTTPKQQTALLQKTGEVIALAEIVAWQTAMLQMLVAVLPPGKSRLTLEGAESLLSDRQEAARRVLFDEFPREQALQAERSYQATLSAASADILAALNRVKLSS